MGFILVSALIQAPAPNSCANHLARAHHGVVLETIWTIAPGGILWAIGLPSLRLLYMMDAGVLGAPEGEAVTVKALGSQWYWTYEHVSILWSASAHHGQDGLQSSPSTLGVESRPSTLGVEPLSAHGLIQESFAVPIDSLEEGQLRNLSVDQSLVLPASTRIQLLVSSNDVIHSFAVPSLGLKIDAIPGRLQSTEMVVHRPSTYYGQCSELCGVLHGFMPVGVVVVPTIPQYLCALSAEGDASK